MEYKLDIVGDCNGCGRALVEARCWRALPKAIRMTIKKDFVGYSSRMLCNRCRTIAEKSDQLLDHERKTMPAAVFADEYTAMRASGVTEHGIRESLGLSAAAFEKAAQRAHLAGTITRRRDTPSAGVVHLGGSGTAGGRGRAGRRINQRRGITR